jgi:hypothetical protein
LSSTFLQFGLAPRAGFRRHETIALTTRINLASIRLLLHFQSQRRCRGEGSHHKAR